MAALVMVLILETPVGLIRGDSGAEQVGDGDRGDDQDDGHDDQEFDQRETRSLASHRLRIVFFSNIFVSLRTLLKKRGRKFVTSSPPLPLKILLQRRLARKSSNVQVLHALLPSQREGRPSHRCSTLRFRSTT